MATEYLTWWQYTMLSKLHRTGPQTHTRIDLDPYVMQCMQERGWAQHGSGGWWITEAGRVVLAENPRRLRAPR